MKCRAIWVTVAGLPIGILAASLARAKPAAIIDHLRNTAGKPDEPSCRRIVDRIKTAAGVDPKAGQPGDPASGYAALFSYPGADESKIDPGYAETVDSMFAIMVVIGETGNGRGMVCQSRLLSNKITYRKQ